MVCNLCGNPQVYNIKSHYTPRAITQNTFGPTDKEAIYVINTEAGSIDKFKGRAHPLAKPDDIKSLPNTGKGIFCKACEDGFGRLESICQPTLIKSLEELNAGTIAPIKVYSG